MPIPSPNLDDRNFADLVEEARQLIAQKSPNWTDLSPGDPGIVLVELFAHLTDVMLYRLNRVPDKAYHEFLRMIGVRLHPPSAATTMLRFKRTTTGGAIAIPQGTRVTVSRVGAGGTAPVFVTTSPVSIAADGKEVDVLGIDCDVIDGESAGVGTGRPGLWLSLARPPVIAATEDGLDLVVGVEATAADLGATGLSTARHPTEFVRDELTAQGVVTAEELRSHRDRARVEIAGIVTHRQQPETAKGVVFLNLEDETGLVNVICTPDVWQRFRRVARTSPALRVRGRVEREQGVINLLAEHITSLMLQPATLLRSRDFH